MTPLETPELEKNFIAPDFKLIGVDEKEYSIDDVKKENGLVVAFICNHCPYVKSIAKKIAMEAKELAKIGIGFIGINSNDTDQYPEDSYTHVIVNVSGWLAGSIPILVSDTTV